MALDLAALEALVPPEPDARVRVAPAPVRRLGPLAAVVALGSARQSGGPPMNIFRVLGQDPALFRAWLVFSGRLLMRGRLPRRDTELVILRVAARCGSGYEWRQHVRIAAKAGLGAEQIAGAHAGTGPPAGAHTRAGPTTGAHAGGGPTAGAHAGGGPFSARQETLLAATDELLDARRFSDATWAALAAELDARETIELCLLVGQYQGLATALGGLGVPVEG